MHCSLRAEFAGVKILRRQNKEPNHCVARFPI